MVRRSNHGGVTVIRAPTSPARAGHPEHWSTAPHLHWVVERLFASNHEQPFGVKGNSEQVFATNA